ncbi:hypothetical protein NM208_g4198 [Fusarium decemcellulare]|uniref:Uncharacterized protein n=1 Tax=Fusarium decemcellulare TaxID=57161 RepID=A0ACC1SLQ4_9HYPO|nr:hypothetical protein NM208_g4198 [Fusarium decemcellulare]
MTTQRIDIDPRGDTLVILQKEGPSQPASPQAASSDSVASLPELHLLCSKKHLTTASARAHRMFESGFSESTPDETDGFYHWKFEPIFDPKAFEIVLKIIHGKTRDIPRLVNTGLLAAIAAVVDDLGCHEAVWFFAQGWIKSSKQRIPDGMCKELAEYILLSFVFEDSKIFEESTRMAIKSSFGSVSTFGLPILPKVLSLIEKERQKALNNLIGGLYRIEKQLLSKELGCSPGCRAMLLGALIQEMAANSLHSPRLSKPFGLLSVNTVVESLKKYHSPAYYGPEQEKCPGKHYGEWRKHEPYGHSSSLRFGEVLPGEVLPKEVGSKG